MEKVRPQGERELHDIPVMDEDVFDLDRDFDILEATEGRRIPSSPKESAPISAQGRIELAKEMLHRAITELEHVGNHTDVPRALVANAMDAGLRVRAVYAYLAEVQDGQ